LVHALVHHTVE